MRTFKCVLLAFFTLIYFNLGAEASLYPYTYCSLDTCLVISKPQNLFFGPLPESVARTCVDSSMYALTFDDGPTTNWDQLLNILKDQDVKATFFINGRNLNDPDHQERIRRAHEQGHQISNHSTNHLNLLEQDNSTIVSELEGTRKKIVEILGTGDARAEKNARIVRPPFGYIDNRIANIFIQNGFTAVRWNSDRYDWQLKSDESPVYLRRAFQHMKFIEDQKGPGLNTSIIDLNHDRSRATLDSLPVMIGKLREQGYRLVTVSECIGK